jgi:predicted nuclease of predicted toxin-antitoxin system
MKLLFDQNLSFKLCRQLQDLFPYSAHVGRIGLSEASDRVIWEHAKAHNFTLVSLDSDFSELAALRGPLPKVIWLRCGNQPTAIVEEILRSHAGLLTDFEAAESTACLEIYWIHDSPRPLTTPRSES